MAKKSTKTKPVSAFSQGNSGSSKLNDFIRDALYTDENVNSFLGNFDDANRDRISDLISNQAYDAPLSAKHFNADTTSSGLSTSGHLLLNQMKNHKLKTAGALGLGAANVAGLLDNPNVVGQLGGGVLGATAVPWAVKKITGNALGPYGKIMTTLGGGALGSLFDTLMSKKAEEEQMMQMLQQGQY